jgi:hypothetical protein
VGCGLLSNFDDPEREELSPMPSVPDESAHTLIVIVWHVLHDLMRATMSAGASSESCHVPMLLRLLARLCVDGAC